MPLVYWANLSPAGPSNLAAIRFTAPIRVSSIRVFPTGARPFQNCPDVVAETEPESFYLEIFFNASTTQPSADSKDKQRAPNALVPTKIAYLGGQMDFTVDLGTEYSTRLMIVKGQFESLSMAIYGDIVSEPPPPPTTYEPSILQRTPPLALSTSLDPANSIDPTVLAQQLIELTDDPPPLTSVARLMLCIKPDSDDWDHPDFPYLYADIDAETEDFESEYALDGLAKPIPDNISHETLQKYAKTVAKSIGPKTEEQALQISKIFVIAASQHRLFALSLCEAIEITTVYDEHVVTEPVMTVLIDAASNSDIAHYLNNDDFLDILHGVHILPVAQHSLKVLARQLEARIRTWDIFEDALSNTEGDFNAAGNMLAEIGSNEVSFGIWLETMTIHEHLRDKIASHPTPSTQIPPPCLFQATASSTSHAEFIVFVRAYIGVAYVLVVLAWADSLGHDYCRERALAVLHLWQSVEGYSEIVNHLLVLRQFSRRLEWITSGDHPPRRSRALAEQIIVQLTKDPRVFLREELVQTVLSLEDPLDTIPENDRLSMRKAALVAEDGLLAAIDELAFNSDHPLSYRRLHTLRVSMAVVQREVVNDQTGWKVLKTSWDEQKVGLLPRLIEILAGVSGDLKDHFPLHIPAKMDQTLVGQLFRTVEEIHHLIQRVSYGFPLASHSLRSLTIATADIFVCTFAFTPLTCTQVSAHGARQACLGVLDYFCQQEVDVEPGRSAAEVILGALLLHGVTHTGADPVHHVKQLYALVDHVLSVDNSDSAINGYWANVFPTVLHDLHAFFSILDADTKAHMLRRLETLDGGVTGVAEWMLAEELKVFAALLLSLREPRALPLDQYQIELYQLEQHIHMLYELFSSSRSWFLTAVTSTADVSHYLQQCVSLLLAGFYESKKLSGLFAALISSWEALSSVELRFLLMIAALRAGQNLEKPRLPSQEVMVRLSGIPNTAIDPQTLRQEIGRTLFFLSKGGNELDAETTTTLSWLLRWLANHEDSRYSILREIALDDLTSLWHKLPATDELKGLRSRITVDEDLAESSTKCLLPTTLQLSIEAVTSLLAPNRIVLPSTPKRNNTPDVFGVVFSPPTALLRSPAATGLTKTYANNDFRQLRQVTSARQNSSRLPSLHVDVGIAGSLS